MLQIQEPQQPDKPQQHRQPSRLRLTIFIVVFLIVLVSAAFWVIYGGVAWYTILPTVVLTALGILVGLFQWLFPLENDQDDVRGPGGGGRQEDLAAPVFLFIEPLTHPEEFFGRERERRTLIRRTRHLASTSIVGERKIGKTWLLHYLALIGKEGENSSKFRFASLDATLPSCHTVAGFTALAMKGLGFPDPPEPCDLTKLEKFVQNLRHENVIPVLCIDEFEGFSISTNADSGSEFDENFFRALRAVAEMGLVLVIASRKPLIDIVGTQGITSGFFNVFEQLTLRPFTYSEAEHFSREKSRQAGFSANERDKLLEYAQASDGWWPPLRLQLVGKMLWGDKKDDPAHYRPNDPIYWQGFKQRLEETYRGVVR